MIKPAAFAFFRDWTALVSTAAYEQYARGMANWTPFDFRHWYVEVEKSWEMSTPMTLVVVWNRVMRMRVERR